MKFSDVKCPFASDEGTLAFTGVLGLAHAAALVIAPKRINDKLLVNPKEMVVGHVDEDCLTASTRVGGAMAGAAAITALALSQKDDMGTARRLALAAQGATMLGVAAIQGNETRKERVKKNIGWATTAIHGSVGAICLYRGLKEGIGGGKSA